MCRQPRICCTLRLRVRFRDQLRSSSYVVGVTHALLVCNFAAEIGTLPYPVGIQPGATSPSRVPGCDVTGACSQ